MTHRFAILVDGAFFVRKLHDKLDRISAVTDVTDSISQIRARPILSGYELLRVYYHDARPATGTLTNPISGTGVDLGQTEVFRRNQSFLGALELKPDIALRLGETSANGWRLKKGVLKDRILRERAIVEQDHELDIEQRGVDLRIGLNMARLSLRSLVNAIVVVTGDSDLIPAFKFARREGVRVVLSHMGHGVKRDLRAHADLILEETEP